MLLGLRGMFLALGVVVFAMSIGGGTMGLRCVFVMFRRFVVCFFHGVFSLLAEKYGLLTLRAPIVASASANGVFSEPLKAELSHRSTNLEAQRSLTRKRAQWTLADRQR